MPPSCSVCAHAECAAINAALAAGDSIRTVSKRFGVSLSAVNRHKKHAGEAVGESAKTNDPDRRSGTGSARAGGVSPSGDVPSGSTSQTARGRAGSASIVAGQRISQEANLDGHDRKGVASPDDTDEDRHARVREAARLIDHTDKFSRVDFLASIGPDYVRGSTPAVCAEVWGMNPTTVENDASIAWMIIKRERNPEVDQAIWWRGMYDLLEQAKQDASLVSGLRKNAMTKLPDGSFKVSAFDLKAISEAQSKARDVVIKIQEQLGKASRLIQSGPAVVVNLTPESVETGKDQYSVQARRLKNAVSTALEEAFELVPDLGLRRAAVERFKERFQQELSRPNG